MTGPEAIGRLLAVGVLWMSVHCVGMCGPLLVGLGVAGTGGAARGLGRTLAYQSGKAVSYAGLGALAGLCGDALARVSSQGGAMLAFAMGVFALAKAAGVLPKPSARVVRIGASPTLLERALRRLPSSPFLLGAALAFLPCMIVMWALGLAALTASPAWGAGVMLALVAMTTPLLLCVGIVTPWLRARAGAQRAFTAVAGVWLVLIGAAGIGAIPHAHVSIARWTMMLW